MKTRNVEFLLTREDHTWDTDFFDIPEIWLEMGPEHYWKCTYGGKPEYSNVVLVAVYCIPPEEDSK